MFTTWTSSSPLSHVPFSIHFPAKEYTCHKKATQYTSHLTLSASSPVINKPLPFHEPILEAYMLLIYFWSPFSSAVLWVFSPAEGYCRPRHRQFFVRSLFEASRALVGFTRCPPCLLSKYRLATGSSLEWHVFTLLWVSKIPGLFFCWQLCPDDGTIFENLNRQRENGAISFFTFCPLLEKWPD